MKASLNEEENFNMNFKMVFIHEQTKGNHQNPFQLTYISQTMLFDNSSHVFIKEYPPLSSIPEKPGRNALLLRENSHVSRIGYRMR